MEISTEQPFLAGQDYAEDIWAVTPIHELAGVLAGLRNRLADKLREMPPSQARLDALIQIGAADTPLTQRASVIPGIPYRGHEAGSDGVDV